MATPATPGTPARPATRPEAITAAGRHLPGGPDLERLTGYLLRRAYVEVAGHTARCMPEGVHVREALLLTLLRSSPDGLSGREIAAVTRLNRTLVVKLVDSLEERGWAVRRPHPTDRRAYALTLSADGRDALETVGAALDCVDVLLTEPLTGSERDQLRTLLTTLLEDDPALQLPGVGELARRCGYLVAHAHRRIRERAEVALRSAGLHPRDFGALSVLAADGPCSQSHLAARLGISPPAALAFVDQLEDGGLVVRRRNLADRRVHALELTDEGRERLAQARVVAGDIQRGVVALLGDEGDRELRRLLSLLLADRGSGCGQPPAIPA